MANLTLRTLTDEQLRTLKDAGRAHHVGSMAGAIGKLIDLYPLTRSRLEEAERRVDELERVLSDYMRAVERSKSAMDEEAEALARLIAWKRRDRTPPRQLSIPA